MSLSDNNSSNEQPQKNWKDTPLTKYNIFLNGQKTWADIISDYEEKAEEFNRKLLGTKKMN